MDENHRPTLYEALVEEATEPLFALDESGAIDVVNDAFVDLSGYERETLRGDKLATFVHEDDRGGVGASAGDSPQRRDDGHRELGEPSADAKPDGRRRRVAVFGRRRRPRRRRRQRPPGRRTTPTAAPYPEPGAQAQHP
ncbi:PAS domain S-box protein [Halovenus aranensis]|uniref:PAS domain S-box protein n=1 Tax=Halovenus aranensis TaxID=890420 RepID=UPI0015A4883A